MEKNIQEDLLSEQRPICGSAAQLLSTYTHAPIDGGSGSAASTSAYSSRPGSNADDWGCCKQCWSSSSTSGYDTCNFRRTTEGVLHDGIQSIRILYGCYPRFQTTVRSHNGASRGSRYAGDQAIGFKNKHSHHYLLHK